MPNASSVFEKHPISTLTASLILLALVLYGIMSLKLIPPPQVGLEKKSVKTVLKQYYFSKVIDNNVGRFIKLREHPPLAHIKERPSRNYVKAIPGELTRKYYVLNTDEYGFIGPSALHEKPDLKVLFLGGSTTECLYMEETERFPYLVGRLLEDTIGMKVNSYNGGVSANESKHSINILFNKGLSLKPQVVVLMHNINDLVMLRRQGTYDYQSSLKSHLQTAQNLFTQVEYPPSYAEVDPLHIQTAFKRNLETFVSMCKIHNIMPVLMTQANRVENDPLYHCFNDTVRQVAEEHSVLMIDLASHVPQTLEYMYDSYHYTAKGSALAARTIYQALIAYPTFADFFIATKENR